LFPRERHEGLLDTNKASPQERLHRMIDADEEGIGENGETRRTLMSESRLQRGYVGKNDSE
jgi:hypothetical protein